MKCLELIQKLETLAPSGCACDWDNVGLLVGWKEQEIHRILIALDATDEVVEEAVRMRADLLLTHHPLIFKPLKKVNNDDFIARRVMELIQYNVNYYAMHTNFDAAPGCMADLAAERLGLTETRVLEVAGTMETDGRPVEYGIGKVGLLPSAMTVKELALLVKERFHLPFITVYGEHAAGETVTRVAIAPGSGKSSIAFAEKAGAEVLVTGDIGHHEGIDAAANHLTVLDAGHYGLEHLFIGFMADYLEREFGARLEIHKAAAAFPAAVL